MGYFVGIGERQLLVEDDGVYDTTYKKVRIADTLDQVDKTPLMSKKDIEDKLMEGHVVKFIGDGRYKCSCGLCTKAHGIALHKKKLLGG